jgi:hypothetical protein
MTRSDFKDEKLIEKIYFPELESHIEKVYGAKQVRALDFQVCKHPELPSVCILTPVSVVETTRWGLSILREQSTTQTAT